MRLPGDPFLHPGTTDRDIERAVEPEEPNGTGYDPVAIEDKAARRKATYAFWAEHLRQPDTCPNCVHWGTSGVEYNYCPVIRMETSDTATCTRFEAKADINANEP